MEGFESPVQTTSDLSHGAQSLTPFCLFSTEEGPESPIFL